MSSDAIELCQRCHKEQAIDHVIMTQDTHAVVVVIRRHKGKLHCFTACHQTIDEYMKTHHEMTVVEERVCKACGELNEGLVRFMIWFDLY